MAAVLTGTPTAVTWAAGANPAGQSITIPADATAVTVTLTTASGDLVLKLDMRFDDSAPLDPPSTSAQGEQLRFHPSWYPD